MQSLNPLFPFYFFYYLRSIFYFDVRTLVTKRYGYH
jgi:hypothetical protein